MPTVQPRARKDETPFSPLLFFVTILATLALVFGALASAAPALWERQLSAPLWKLAGVFLCAHAANAFVEFFFHRYVLHAHPFRFLKRFYIQHTLHHALTSVRREKGSGNSEAARSAVVSRYPITEPRQYEASYFPWFSLGAFIAVASPVLALAQWAFPNAPVILGGIIAVAWSMTLYELIHAAEHLPFESFWKGKVEHPRFGRLWRKVYGFHVRHHAANQCNESVSGFFGLPLPDFLFRTYAKSRVVLTHGAAVEPADFSPPTPCWLIQFLDRVSARLMTLQRQAR